MRLNIQSVYKKKCNCRLDSFLHKHYSNFVPKHNSASSADVDLLQEYLVCHKNILVITGAGVSTESGIPDYRSEGVGLYSTSPNRPMQYQTFMSSKEARRRYWMRNYIGWPKFSSVLPNLTHFTLAKWQKEGKIQTIVTQNVDRLHFKAGSEKVIELHGTSYRVKCMTCGHTISRFLFQQMLHALNNVEITEVGIVRPDGDVEVNENHIKDFRVPACKHCNGILKPDVVMFGESVLMSTVTDVYGKVRESDGLLVLGSSLMVFSAYRFILEASQNGKPIAIVNIGPTRADDKATLKISAKCGDVLSRIQRLNL